MGRDSLDADYQSMKTRSTSDSTFAKNRRGAAQASLVHNGKGARAEFVADVHVQSTPLHLPFVGSKLVLMFDRD
jgi:hypothetical protein